jgi:hypothetical protein
LRQDKEPAASGELTYRIGKNEMSVFSRLWPLAPALVIAIGAVFVAIGGFWAAYRQSHFNDELRQKNEQIARLTGGDGFCWIAFQIVNAGGQPVNANAMPDDLMLIPSFIHQGPYPLYEVSANIVNVDELRKDAARAMTQANAGNFAPGSYAKAIGVHILHHGKDINFNIFYVARNGSWLQKLGMRWIGNGWALANRVDEGMGGGKQLLIEVSPNYPRNSVGEVDWDEKPEPPAADP